jgi:hypothetical protein
MDNETAKILTPPTEQEKIDSLRASILGTAGATEARFAEDTKDLEPLKPIVEPLGIGRLVKVLKKKQIPFLLIYLTGNEKERHANFQTTIEHPNAADMCHHVIEANRAAFWPNPLESDS